VHTILLETQEMLQYVTMFQKDRKCGYKVTLRCVPATIAAVEKQ